MASLLESHARKTVFSSLLLFFCLEGPFQEFLLKQFLGWQIELVLSSVDVGIVGQGELDDGILL